MFKEPKPENHLTAEERVLSGEFISPTPLDELLTDDDIIRETELDRLYVDLWDKKLISTATLAGRLGIHIDWETDGVEELLEN